MLGYPEIDAKTILKCDLEKCGVMVQTVDRIRLHFLVNNVMKYSNYIYRHKHVFVVS
jgi:hypothetical protein